MNQTHATEITKRQRFEFGSNWAKFLNLLDDKQIDLAIGSLKFMLGVTDLKGRRFLDAGSGSGLFSLAARRLGADVYSFDYDPKSVACTRELRHRYFPDDDKWIIDEASVLNSDYLEKLGQFDIVYSWGVLHHTGSMFDALGKVAPLVAYDGSLFVAIYNDQGWISRYWSFVKRCYARNIIFRGVMLLVHIPYLFGVRFLVRAATGRLDLERGMLLWYDMIDWIGGYPFETASPEEIFDFYRAKGFGLVKLKTCGGRHGCNEFVFFKGNS